MSEYVSHTVACRALLRRLQKACGKKGSTAGRWVGYWQAHQELMHTMQSTTQVQLTSATPTATGRSLMTSPISDVLLFTTWCSWWDDSWWVCTQKKAEGLRVEENSSSNNQTAKHSCVRHAQAHQITLTSV
jgi:hypothetical protein